MSAFLKETRRYLLLYPAMLAVMVLALWGSCGLRGNIRANVQESVRMIQQEGLYPEYFGIKLFQMDNYTDTLMLWEAVSVEEDSALMGAMRTPIYEMNDYRTLPEKLERYLANGSEGLEGGFDYNRYWHGYLIWLRPLLLVFTLKEIRLVNAVVLFALLEMVLRRIGKTLGWQTALCFGLSQLAVTIWWVPRQNQFFWAFAVAYVGCLLALGKPGENERDFCLALFGLGGAVVYFELLVTPLITLGLPVCLYLCRHGDRKPMEKLIFVVKGSVLWAVGYGLFWASRWVIAGAITGTNVIANAANQAGIRTGGGTAVWKGMELTLGNILRFVLDAILERHLLLPLLAALAIGLVLFLLFCKGLNSLWENSCFLLCALMTPAWFFVLREHSVQHFWFTWRALTITVLAGLLFIVKTCSLRAALDKIQFRRRQE